jgi:hypothetical protein
VGLFLVPLVFIINMCRDGFTFYRLLLCVDLVESTAVAICAHSVEYCNAYFQVQKITGVSIGWGSINCTDHVLNLLLWILVQADCLHISYSAS